MNMLIPNLYTVINTRPQKPITAITALIERLTKDEYEIDDLNDLPVLIEAIQLQQSTGPTEAARAIRKKLYVNYSSLLPKMAKRHLASMAILTGNFGH